MAACKVTVLKRTLNADIATRHIGMEIGPCDQFKDGDEFLITAGMGKPDNFCGWAWNDIYKVVVTIARGGNFNDGMFTGWMKDDKSMITCCTDGVRPVIFKVERIEEN